MSEMIRNASVLLSLFLLFLTTSCHKEEGRYLIGVSQCSEDLWRNTVNDEIRRQAAFMRNMDVLITSAKDNSDEQIEQIQWLVSQNVDLLIISPNESEALEQVITGAYRSGIPVILLDRTISSENYTAYVGADNRQLAEKLGVYVSDLLRGSGNVAIIRGLEGSTADMERYEGFMSEMASHPDINIVVEEHGDFLRDLAHDRMTAVLHTPEGKNIDLIFAMNDQMAIGAREAYRLHPELNVPVIIGIDALPGAGGGIEAINDGIIDASFIYPTGGYKVMEVAAAILNGQPFSKKNLLNTALVDRSNVRILKMQNEQVTEQQYKVDVLSERLQNSTDAFSRQRSFSNILTVFMALFAALLIVLCSLINRQRRLNRQLNQRNEESRNQVETLKSQQEQLQALSRQLEDATQAKLVFFTDITHEFKTPLTLILGPVEEMLHSGRYAPEDYESLQLVQRNGTKLMNLLNQILEFRTYENGKMELKAEMDHLDMFLNGINQMFKPNMCSRSVNFEYLTDGNDYLMAFDKDKIDKIYFNLLSNALKYVDEGGTIRVRLQQNEHENGRSVRLDVFNTGSFIPEDKLKDVFRRFYHLDDEHENSGVGLALSKSLIEAHNGTITVSSIAGEGTTFTVTVPIVRNIDGPDNRSGDEHRFIQKQLELDREFKDAEARMHTYDTDSREEAPGGEKQKILIIEDNADMRSYEKLVLSTHYNVLQAENGKDGIKMAVSHIPDLIITDILMPGMDGFEVCRVLKANVITRNIPVICLTACASDEQKMQSYAAGADGYMTKPFNANLLRIRIAKMIEKNREISEELESELFPGTSSRTLGDRQREFMDRFRKYVESHIQDNISIEDLTVALGVSKSGLYRTLKEITDYNPVEIISLIKVKRGLKLMMTEHRNITEAAYATGFSSSSYFTKIFVKFYRETPSEYIKKFNCFISAI